MSGDQAHRIDTHRRKELKYDQEKVTGQHYQEIRGCILNNVLKNAWHSRSPYNASVSCGVNDNGESRDILGEGVGIYNMSGEGITGHTIYKRKCGMYDHSSPPRLEETDTGLAESRIWKIHRCRTKVALEVSLKG